MERESLLATREKELGDARSELVLLEAGCRPEELQAAIANRDKLSEEVKYLEELNEKRNLSLHCPVRSLRNGSMICWEVLPRGGTDLRDWRHFDAGYRCGPGRARRFARGTEMPVTFKARTLPFHTFDATVTKIAAIGFKGEKDTHTSVSIYCRVIDPTSDLRPGTTGYARIYTGPRPVGEIIFYRMLTLRAH